MWLDSGITDGFWVDETIIFFILEDLSHTLVWKRITTETFKKFCRIKKPWCLPRNIGSIRNRVNLHLVLNTTEYS